MRSTRRERIGGEMSVVDNEAAAALANEIEDVILARQDKGLGAGTLCGALAFLAANFASRQPDPREAQRALHLTSVDMLASMLKQDAKDEEREPATYTGEDLVEDMAMSISIAGLNEMSGASVGAAFVNIVAGFLLGLPGDKRENFNIFGERVQKIMRGIP